MPHLHVTVLVVLMCIEIEDIVKKLDKIISVYSQQDSTASLQQLSRNTTITQYDIVLDVL